MGVPPPWWWDADDRAIATLAQLLQADADRIAKRNRKRGR